MLGVGILMIIVGVVLRAHYEPVAQACTSGLGTLTQGLTSAPGNCSTAQGAASIAPWLIGVGAVVSTGCALALGGLLGSMGIGAKNTETPADESPAASMEVPGRVSSFDRPGNHRAG
ncbi:MAG TPA: hypothetical protein VGM10_32190 [Actinocrinis sp.]